MTILQVLLYDPLYAWTMSPQKAYMLQHRRATTADTDMSEFNTTAGDLLDYAGHTNSEFGNVVLFPLFCDIAREFWRTTSVISSKDKLSAKVFSSRP